MFDDKETNIRIYGEIAMLIFLMAFTGSVLCIDGKQKTDQRASKGNQNNLVVSSIKGRQKYWYYCPKRNVTSEREILKEIILFSYQDWSLAMKMKLW